MRPAAVVVVHRETMLAEGIAAALASYPGIVPLGVATSSSEAEAKSERADAVALDMRLPGADGVARTLRSRGSKFQEAKSASSSGVSFWRFSRSRGGLTSSPTISLSMILFLA